MEQAQLHQFCDSGRLVLSLALGDDHHRGIAAVGRRRPSLLSFNRGGMIGGMIDDDASEIPMAVLEALLHHGIPVKAAREAAELSVESLAAQSRVSAYRIEAFESGEATPTLKEAEAISKATGVPAAIFVKSK